MLDRKVEGKQKARRTFLLSVFSFVVKMKRMRTGILLNEEIYVCTRWNKLIVGMKGGKVALDLLFNPLYLYAEVI